MTQETEKCEKFEKLIPNRNILKMSSDKTVCGNEQRNEA